MGGTNRTQNVKASSKMAGRAGAATNSTADSDTDYSHASPRRTSLSPPKSPCEESTSSASISPVSRPAHPPPLSPIPLTSRQRIEIARFRSILNGKKLVMEQSHVQEISSTLYKHRLIEQLRMAQELRSSLEDYADQAVAATINTTTFASGVKLPATSGTTDSASGKTITEGDGQRDIPITNSSAATKAAPATASIGPTTAADTNTNGVNDTDTFNAIKGDSGGGIATRRKIVTNCAKSIHELATLTEAVQGGYTLGSYDKYHKLYKQKRKKEAKELEEAKNLIEDQIDRMVMEETPSAATPARSTGSSSLLNRCRSLPQHQQKQPTKKPPPGHLSQEQQQQKQLQRLRTQRQLQRHQSQLKNQQQDSQFNHQHSSVNNRQNHQNNDTQPTWNRSQHHFKQATTRTESKEDRYEDTYRGSRDIAVKVIAGNSMILLSAPKRFTDKIGKAPRRKSFPFNEGNAVPSSVSRAKGKTVLLKRPPQQTFHVKKTTILAQKEGMKYNQANPAVSENGHARNATPISADSALKPSVLTQRKSTELLGKKSPISNADRKRSFEDMQGGNEGKIPGSHVATAEGSPAGDDSITKNSKPSPTKTATKLPPTTPVPKPRKCHICKSLISVFRRCQYWNPSGAKCQKVYCDDCVNKYDVTRTESNGTHNEKEWHCPSCCGNCPCESCIKFLEKMRMKRVAKRTSRHVTR